MAIPHETLDLPLAFGKSADVPLASQNNLLHSFELKADSSWTITMHISAGWRLTYHIILIPPSLPPTIFFSIPSIVCKNVPLFPRSICQSGSFAVISLLFVSSILFTFHKSALKWLFSKARHSPKIKVSRLTARNSSSSSSSFASSKIPQIHQRITYRTYTVSTKLPTNRMRTVSLRNGFGLLPSFCRQSRMEWAPSAEALFKFHTISPHIWHVRTLLLKNWKLPSWGPLGAVPTQLPAPSPPAISVQFKK